MSNTADAVSPASGQSYGAPSYRGYVLFCLTLVYALNFIDRVLLSVVAQPVIEAFNLSDSQYGFLSGPPFAIFYALVGIPIAMAADRYNRVVIISLCIALWSVMAALCGFATSFLFLLIARIGVAVGEAGCTPPANSLIGDYFKPKSRANALGIYAMGVTIGAALANAFGGPIATQLNGETVARWLEGAGMLSLFGPVDWASIEGWRLAFIVIGAPGVIVALLILFTVKEPPRGYADPPGAHRVQKASIVETLRELASKPTFWSVSLGASLAALVGYGLSGFQAPLGQRLHGINPGEFALNYGVPLSLAAAAGTFLGGFIIEKLTPRFPTAVSWIPAIGLLLSVPIYIYIFYLPTEQFHASLPIWCVAGTLHYAYLASQYTIGQGVVSMRSRASAIAIMLLMIALIGNALGPQIVGWLSDMFMGNQLAALDPTGALTADLCRARDLVEQLPDDQQAICRTAYAEGLRQSMATTALIFVPAAACFAISSFTLKRDLVATPH